METASHNKAAEPSGVRGLAEAGLSYVEARARLLQIEVREAGERLGRLLIIGLISVGCLIIAWSLAIPVIVWVISNWGGWSWQRVAGGLALGHLAIGGLAMVILRRRIGHLRLFEETIDQCRRDRECLRRK